MVYRSTEKTKNKKAQRKQQLLSSAIELLSEGGFAKLTMDAVAKRANVATGTVYKYFDSKAILCAEVFKIITETEVAIIKNIAEGESRPDQRLKEAIVTFSHRALNSRHQAYALIFEPIDPLVEKERLKYRHAYSKLFEELLEEGVASGIFAKQTPAISAAAIVGIISEALTGPLTWSSEHTKFMDKKQLVEEIQRFCLKGIAAE